MLNNLLKYFLDSVETNLLRIRKKIRVQIKITGMLNFKKRKNNIFSSDWQFLATSNLRVFLRCMLLELRLILLHHSSCSFVQG